MLMDAKNLELIELPRFKNGWFCPQCGCLTEHTNVKGREVCLEEGCGFALGSPSLDVRAKQKAYRERSDVKAKKKAYQQRKKLERLEAKLTTIGEGEVALAGVL
jgi:hypothetical protein